MWAVKIHSALGIKLFFYSSIHTRLTLRDAALAQHDRDAPGARPAGQAGGLQLGAPPSTLLHQHVTRGHLQQRDTRISWWMSRDYLDTAAPARDSGSSATQGYRDQLMDVTWLPRQCNSTGLGGHLQQRDTGISWWMSRDRLEMQQHRTGGSSAPRVTGISWWMSRDFLDNATAQDWGVICNTGIQGSADGCHVTS